MVASLLLATVLLTGLFGFLMMGHAPHGAFQMGNCVVAVLNGAGCAATGFARSIDFHVGLFKEFAASHGVTVFAVVAAFVVIVFPVATRAVDAGPLLPRLIMRSELRQTRWRRRVAEWLALHERRAAPASV